MIGLSSHASGSAPGDIDSDGSFQMNTQLLNRKAEKN